MSTSVDTGNPRMSARVHGGVVRAELHALGLDTSDVLDFSVNCNPYGPCPEMVEALRAAAIDRYPDPAATQARQAIAALLGTGPDRIALGNGAAELLWTLAHTFVDAGRNVVVVEPTFCEFRAAAQRIGGSVHEWRATPADRFAIDLAGIGTRIRECRANVVYMCIPNTPTGLALPASDVVEFAERHTDVIIILDQSFLSLSRRAADISVPMPKNVVCVRSMTKEHGIPGVRVGYLVAAPDIVASLDERRPAWTTSAFAQAAALAACNLTAFVDGSRDELLAQCSNLATSLRELGLDPIESTTGFSIVRTGAARSLREGLLVQHRILVRDCSSFGLPDCIRVAARSDSDHQRLMVALRNELR